ncbi:hypothetical protein CBR_g38989 [Chara braunii]|uniref:Uncharacterized protein n=1 Tax=Chara braunii TaxID=69332 RepID=A0A388K0X4_CHABU|nr:hypothetical protein CBR_g38989 [Chara braunii]|eukprot:GBG63677.1 hypothetical protein CBR_g38989 [Chara braunii]
MQCSILEYLAASKPARDELQMITRKTRIPLSEEGQGAPKAEASTVAVTGVTARADRMATVLLDGMEGVPPDKFYILGSGAVETIINDGAMLDAVIDNDSEAVIIDDDLVVQVGLGLDRSYLFEIETADGRKQQITEVCHKAAIEVQGVRVTLPVFAVKNCSSDLLLGRTWLSHVHAVTIERPDGSQTLSIKKPDGTRVMIETVEPRDPRNRAALAVGARLSDQWMNHRNVVAMTVIQAASAVPTSVPGMSNALFLLGGAVMHGMSLTSAVAAMVGRHMDERRRVWVLQRSGGVWEDLQRVGGRHCRLPRPLFNEVLARIAPHI